MRTSPHFLGPIATAIPAAEFPLSNLLIADGKYDYEGNWFFCVLDSPRLPVLRIGFGRGIFDGRDYGSPDAPAPFLAVHLEIVTDQGVVIYVPAGVYKPSDVQPAQNHHEIELLDKGQRVFRIAGWPRVECQFRSPAGDLAVDAQVDVRTVTIFPDTLMPHNRFAMWGSVGTLTGECRWQGERIPLQGTAFFDHPRIQMEHTGSPDFGFYLYQPIKLSDGSHIISYVTKDRAGHLVPDCTFVYWITPDGKLRTLWNLDAFEISFDSDQQPQTWRAQWHDGNLKMEITANVRPLPILRAWGSPKLAKTRSEYRVCPLCFDVQVQLNDNGQQRHLTGHGLAEMIPHPDVLPHLVASH